MVLRTVAIIVVAVATSYAARGLVEGASTIVRCLARAVTPATLEAMQKDPRLPASLRFELWRLTFPVIPDQPDASAALRKAYVRWPRNLSAEEVAKFRKDGVIKVKAVIPCPEVLPALAPLVATHTHSEDYPIYGSPAKINGALRAILQEVPLKEMVAPLFGNVRPSNVTLSGAKIWHKTGRKNVGYDQNWHTEDFEREWGDINYAIMWLALTDAPGALEFLPHKPNETRDNIRRCKHTTPYAPFSSSEKPMGECLMRTTVWQEHHQIWQSVGGGNGLPPVGDHPALWRKDLKAGDAFIWHGQTLHRGLSQIEPRTAISLLFKNVTPSSDKQEDYSGHDLVFEDFEKI